MPGIDWIPGVSHLKAGVQAITGDTKGAGKTMENFHRECPVVSQVFSVVQLVTGDAKGAIETQIRCWGTVENVLNGIPVVGHAKGLVHHIAGDHVGGTRALNGASRSTVVMASGAAVGLATGGLGAIPAGIAAGFGYDVTATGITGKDQGYIAAINNAFDNPSAGAIFDAAFMPVGDGLAGYSGGQIAIKITNIMATKVRLTALKDARLAKLEQLAIADDGQAVILGDEMNALTSEIDVIEQGTPYFIDEKSGEIGFDPPPSNTAVAVPGYVDENNESEQKKIEYVRIIKNNPRPVRLTTHVKRNNVNQQEDLIEKMSAGFEDALDYDSYITATKLTPQQKQTIFSKYNKQQPNRHIPQAPFTSVSALYQLLRCYENHDPNNDPPDALERTLNNLINPSWLTLDMPREFPYTAEALLNSDVQGLHHSFIRHMTEWKEFISFHPALMNRLNPVINEIIALESVTAKSAQEAREKSQKARDALRNTLKKLPNDVYLDVRTAFVEIQLLMHGFIQQNLTSAKYMGRSVNDSGQVRLLFGVKTITGRPRQMVVCLSDTLYYPLHNNRRPTRSVITVFFK